MHDLGGMHGFGPVQAEPEATEPLFHHPWEPDVLTSMFATMRLGRWSLDEFRQTIEQQPPLEYLRRTYYEKWLAALETLAIRHGLLTESELAGRLGGTTPEPGIGSPTWAPSFELPPEAPRYTVGQRVRARNRHPKGHTRQPRYVRGRIGTVISHVGAEPLPELAATGVCQPEHVYLVRFEAAELWGEQANASQAKTSDAVFIELWDSYLEPLP
ncbi:MAG: nitrile hydratase subunit beta [Acidimicrobiales bacterium]